MKAILVGLGNAGFSWYKRLKERGLLAAVVDTDERLKLKMEADRYPFYKSLHEALCKERADFLVNVTPPGAHSAVNHAAFDYKLPVLCEKPISFDYDESVQVVRRAEKERIPFMIAENYRRWPFVRKMKQLLEEGAIGELSVIDIRFYRYHHVQRNYTVSLLRDIGVHHLDMIRYFTDREGRKVQAQLYHPIGGWAEDKDAALNAHLYLEMSDGARVTYNASICSRGEETPWSGNWRLEGTEGALELVNKEIHIYRNGVCNRIDYDDILAQDTLEDFLTGLQSRRPFETSGKNYLNTEALVHYAVESSEAGKALDISLAEIE